MYYLSTFSPSYAETNSSKKALLTTLNPTASFSKHYFNIQDRNVK